MSAPTLEALVGSAESLADDIDRVVAAISVTAPSRDLAQRLAVLRAQSMALRNMQPDADGFLPQRLTWSLGQSVAVVLPAALRRLTEVGLVGPTDADACVDRARALARDLRAYETT